LIFVSDSPADIAQLKGQFVGQLALNGEIKRVHYVGTEVRIQGFAGTRSNCVHTGKVRLWKCLTGRRNGCRQAIGSDSESRAECRTLGRAATCRARTRCGNVSK